VKEGTETPSVEEQFGHLMKHEETKNAQDTLDLMKARAELLKLLGHPIRLVALAVLQERPMAVGELLDRMQVAQPVLSQQLAVLRRAGLVSTRREGTRIIYDAEDAPLEPLLAALDGVLRAQYARRDRIGAALRGEAGNY